MSRRRGLFGESEMLLVEDAKRSMSGSGESGTVIGVQGWLTSRQMVAQLWLPAD